eukprot:TRINITY_DN3353_c0_g1_i2.p1 TRINITY_DN3353_c0_g1~~TRINITY_DN3353_c0_g1_i2.p1  ORF type:complete len:803 (-),score=264.40 TRINITY_DN3353_c0_g1_i2:99-2477(-)
MDLQAFEKRADETDKLVTALEERIKVLESGSGVVSAEPKENCLFDKVHIPIGHTSFSWGSSAVLASPAISQQQSSVSAESKVASIIIRHGENVSALVKVTSAYLKSIAPANFFKFVVKKGQAEAEATIVPLGVILHGDDVVAKFLARQFPSCGLYGSTSSEVALSQTEVDQWIHSATSYASADKLAELDLHLTFRTFVVGTHLTLADIAVFDAVKKSKADLATHAHLSRWFNFLSAQPSFGDESSTNNKKAAAKPVAKTNSNIEQTSMGAQGAFLELPGAEMGKVVTRFPPEPSGYLHIGHAKAALLNNHYARHYNGTLILRFDDTNPSKEKDEFVQNIMEDLKTLEITPDKITYTSDYFDALMEEAEKLIKSGKGYIDSTPKEQLREERGKGIESKFRSQSVEENLKMWEEMKAGTELGKQCVLRAKINMQAANKVLRDPAFYRCVDAPHHRTGSKYKVYPMYDFACPIVDSIEGVTHSLRSNEYHDRNPLYYWVFEALPHLRPVKIEDFSRLNFKYVLLSKRKLQQFVDTGVVSGWNHPSFPTIQGVSRRGLTLKAMRDFVLAQGASKATNLMEMEKLWAVNKQIIDPIIPRHTALAEGKVRFVLSNGPAEVTTKKIQRHKKNASLGEKDISYSNIIFLEKEDADHLQANEEVTLMDWGNAIIRERVVQGDNLLELRGELHLEGDFKTTKKKLTWLADVPELVPVTLEKYGYLITKEKLEKDDSLEAATNPNIVVKTNAIGDPNLKTLQKGQKLQLERRGYYIVDKAFSEGELVLIEIPDGKITNVYKRG